MAARGAPGSVDQPRFPDELSWVLEENPLMRRARHVKRRHGDVQANIRQERVGRLPQCLIFFWETNIVSPLRTDSLPFVSKSYWPENADDAIMDAP